MDREYFQTRQIGLRPFAAVIDDVEIDDAIEILAEHGRVFILQVHEYDPDSRRVHIRLKPGNGMVPVIAMKEASGVKDCE